MIRSTLTIADYILRAEDLLDLDTNSDLRDLTVVIAINDFLSLYTPEEQKAMPSLSIKETIVTVPEAGYDMSVITSFGFIKRVYDNGMQLFKISKANPHYGYTFDGTTLTLVGVKEAECTITYFEKTAQYNLSTLPALTTVIPVLAGVEEGVERMIASRYTRRDQSDPQAAVNYKNDALGIISNFFVTNKKAAYISLHN